MSETWEMSCNISIKDMEHRDSTFDTFSKNTTDALVETKTGMEYIRHLTDCRPLVMPYMEISTVRTKSMP